MRVLVVDDDPRIRRLIEAFLVKEGIPVLNAENLDAARRLIETQDIDIALVDINLAGEDGLSLARDLGRRADIGVIIVSGKSDTVDRIVGLEIGADDYITKPFDLRELLARLRAVHRRLAQKPGAEERAGAKIRQVGEGTYEFDGWRLDPATRRLETPTGKEESLTSGEYALLCVFLRHPRRVLSRDQLMNEIAGRDWTPYDRAIDTRVRRLRSKLKEEGRSPRLIKTVRGTGYVFAANVTRRKAEAA